MALKTAAFAAQDALVTALKASASLTAWTIDYGLPLVRPSQLNIWVSEDVSEWTQGLAASSTNSRNETFTLTVYLYAQHTGATAKEVRDELAVAGGVVEQIVGSTPFLSGSVMYAEIAGAQYEGAFADPEGRAREGVLKLSIACTAYLTV